jgi:hypothetical protein
MPAWPSPQDALIPFVPGLRLRRQREAVMKDKMKLVQIAAVCFLNATWAVAAPDRPPRRCAPIGGSILTNLAAVDANTSLGTATGDLKGAVAARILEVGPGENGTTVFTVQHHFVTETGDTIAVDIARATAAMVAPGLFAIVSYPVTIVGGTGRFDGATGHFENIGEVDQNSGHTVFRYQGRVCLREPER